MHLKFVLLILLINSIHRSRGYSFSKPVCSWDEFYEPYIIVKESRSEMPEVDIRAAGTYDLRRNGGILCLNGPAFLHTKLDTHDPVATGYLIDSASIIIYQSECMTFNIRDPKANPNSAKPGELPEITESTIVGGTKIYWVTLFGDSSDYRKPSKEFYNHPQFGYRDTTHPYVGGASFSFMVAPTGKLQNGPAPVCNPIAPATTCPAQPLPFLTLTNNPKAYCLTIGGDVKRNVTFVPTPTFDPQVDTGYVCTVKEPFGDPDISGLFHSNLSRLDYEWYDCPPGQYGNTPDEATGTPGPLDDFRMLDPQHLRPAGSPHGVKPHPGHPNFPFPSSTNNYVPPTYGTFPYPGYCFYTDPSPCYTNRPTNSNSSYENIRYDVTDCSPDVPKPDDSCDLGNEKACQYLDHVMTRDKVLWHYPLKDDGTPDNTVIGNLPPDDDIIKGNWRIEILTLVEEIFNEACPQVSPMLAPAVGRIIEYYLRLALEEPSVKTTWADPDRQKDWKVNGLMNELLHCKDQINDITRMEFRRVRNLDILSEIDKMEEQLANPSLPMKTFAEVQSKLSRKKYRFPFDVKVIRPNKEPHNIFYHREAAELDYDLNLAIDLHWKIFNTVTGYCNLHYQSKMPAMTPNLYTLYDTDFFSYMTDKWINFDDTDTDNQVFQQLFGAFVNGAPSIYLDSCMEGAFIAAGAQSWRELRPVSLRDDSKTAPPDPITNIIPKEVNYFTRQPGPDWISLYNSR